MIKCEKVNLSTKLSRRVLLCKTKKACLCYRCEGIDRKISRKLHTKLKIMVTFGDVSGI